MAFATIVLVTALCLPSGKECSQEDKQTWTSENIVEANQDWWECLDARDLERRKPGGEGADCKYSELGGAYVKR